MTVLSDILEAVDRGDVVTLTCLDLRAVFGTFIHDILKRQTVSVGRGNCISNLVAVICGMPQGSVLGPFSFVPYTADIAALVKTVN